MYIIYICIYIYIYIYIFMYIVNQYKKQHNSERFDLCLLQQIFYDTHLKFSILLYIQS